MLNLNDLFIKYGSDKSSMHHNYSPIYEKILEPFMERYISMLILGVGGYHHIDRGGGDLVAFKQYLPNAKIIGVDEFDKSFLNQDRIKTYISDQANEEALYNIIKLEGIPNIVIDDCSHQCPLTIKSFEIIFPLLQEGAIYIIEDIEGSWYELYDYGGCKDVNNHSHPSTMNYFKSLLNDINAQYIERYEIKNGLCNMIESIQFFKNFISIVKK